MEGIGSFKEEWLAAFYSAGTPYKAIPHSLESVLARKLDMLNAAADLRDLRSPPGNRLEALQPPLAGFYSIRINERYRLLFRWRDGQAHDVRLDDHRYRPYQ